MSRPSRTPHRTPLVRGVIALAGAMLLSSCAGADASGAPEVVVHDSAGVTIVDNPAALQLPRLSWTLGPDPLLDVGTLDGPLEKQLFRVRDAMRLPDGRVAVLNGGSFELRLYGADGAHLGSFGSEGDGPGEFRSAWSLIEWPGDTVGVWDNRSRRFTLFGSDGTLGRTLPLPPLDGIEFPRLSLVTPDGRLVLEGSMLGELPETSGTVRVPMLLQVVGPEGDLQGDLGRYPGTESYLRVGENEAQILRLPFMRSTVVAQADAEIVIAPTDRLELRFHRFDGGLSRIVRFAEPPRLVTEADRAAELEARLDNAPEQARPGIRAMMETIPLPDTLPAFTSVLTDEAGAQWIQLFRSPADEGPAQWLVVDPDGVGLGTIELPDGFDVYEIGDDYVLGRALDELDVEHVQLWSLRRDAG